jgi:hypothetical protein
VSAPKPGNYRFKQFHPGRPGQPLEVSEPVKDEQGNHTGKWVVIGRAGQSASHLNPEQLKSVINNGYVELSDEPVEPTTQATSKRTKKVTT